MSFEKEVEEMQLSLNRKHTAHSSFSTLAKTVSRYALSLKQPEAFSTGAQILSNTPICQELNELLGHFPTWRKTRKVSLETSRLISFNRLCLGVSSISSWFSFSLNCPRPTFKRRISRCKSSSDCSCQRRCASRWALFVRRCSLPTSNRAHLLVPGCRERSDCRSAARSVRRAPVSLPTCFFSW